MAVSATWSLSNQLLPMLKKLEETKRAFLPVEPSKSRQSRRFVENLATPNSQKMPTKHFLYD